MELNRRQTELLIFLIQDRKPKYGSQLAAMFNITDRTVRNDIQRINEELAEFSITIKASKKDGYYIPGDSLSRAREKNILQEIAKQYDFDIPETQNERMVYLLFSMMSGSRYTQEDIEELFFLSPSVVYGDLKAMEKWLKNTRIDVELKKKDKYYYVEEKEETIRSLISGIYTQRSNLVLELKYSYFISGDTKYWEMIYELIPFVCEFMKEENIQLTGRSIFSFAADIALTYFRSSQGYHVTPKSFQQELGQRFEKAIVSHDPAYGILNQDDYGYLMMRLAGKDFMSANPFLSVHENTRKAVACFAEKVKSMGVTVTDYEDIASEIEEILYIKKQHYFYSISKRRRLFENNIEMLYLTVILRYYLHVFYPDTEFNRHDLARLTICVKGNVLFEKKHLMLVSDSSRYTVQNIRNTAERIIGDKAVIEKVSNQYEYYEHVDGIDGIITTVPVNEADIPYLEMDLINSNDYLKEINSFLSSLDNHTVKVYEEKTDETDVYKIISSLIDELRGRNIIRCQEYEYIVNNIADSAIFRVCNETLMVMIPMISSADICRFNIQHKGNYRDENYKTVSLTVFTENMNIAPAIKQFFS